MLSLQDCSPWRTRCEKSPCGAERTRTADPLLAKQIPVCAVLNVVFPGHG
jgi:hypothetical protein